MRSCKFYTAHATHMGNHDGLEPSDDYRFDKPFPLANCEHPELSAGRMVTMCSYENDHTQCPVYTEEPITPLRRVGFDHHQEKEVLELGRSRVQFGIVEFYITTRRVSEGAEIESSTENFLHQVNAHEYGEGAEEFARELFDYEVSSRSSLPHHEMELPQSVKPSYLREVTDEVRVAS